MMQLRTLALIAAGTFIIGACSLNPFNRNQKLDEVEQAEKAGRIAMVSGDLLLEADPDMASVAVILPDARSVTSWTQSGSGSTKMVGHVRGGQDFRIAWRWNGAKGSDRNRTITAAPVAANGKVYLIDAAQQVFAISAETGKTVWRKELGSRQKRDQRAFGGGIAVAGDRLIVASGFGFITALDIDDGNEIWRTRTDAPMTGSPTILEDRIFVASNNNEFYAISLETGEIEWTDQAIAEAARVLSSPSPAAVDDLVVAPYSSGELIAYLPSNGRRLWSDTLTLAGRFTPISAINDIASRPILHQGLAFAASQSGVLAAIDGRSGSRVWAVPLGSTQAPALAGEFLFAVSVDSQLACIEIATGRVVWVKELPRYEKPKNRKDRISYSGPVIASGRLVLASSDGRLLALSPQNGEVIEEMDLGGGRFGGGTKFYIEPIVFEGKILILADDGTLIALR